MEQRTKGIWIVSRFWSSNFPIAYVSNVPGSGGYPNSDWEYTDNAAKAMPLNEYFKARFRTDCRRVNAEARFHKL